MLELEYLIDEQGRRKAVVIPIEIWDRLFSDRSGALEALTEVIEDYALNKAMDEAKETTLMDREEALAYLDSETP